MYLKKRIPLAIIFMMLFLCCFTRKVVAQDLSMGVSASFDYNAYWFANYEEVKDIILYRGRPGYSIGAIFKSYVSSNIFIKSGFFYSAKNFSQVIFEYRPIDPGNPMINDDGPYKTKFSSKYIEVPVDLSFKIKSKESVKTYFLIGVLNSFRIGYSSKADIPFGRSEIKYSKYLLSMKTGIGVLFDLGNNDLLIEPQLRYYLTDVHESTLTKSPFYLGIEVSYLLPIKRKE